MSTKVTAKNTEKEFELPNVKVRLKPVKRVRGKNGEIHLKHEASFLFKDSKFVLAPVTYENGTYKNPLTREEQKYFENPDKSGLSFMPGDLSVTKKENNFWSSKEARITLREESYILDLSNPFDYLKYAILRSHSRLVAMSPEYLEVNSPMNKRSYKWVIEPMDYYKKKEAQNYFDTAEIYEFLRNIENNRSAMINMLTILEPKKKVASNSDVNFLIGELNKKAIEDPRTFSRVMKDEDRNVKAILARAVRSMAVRESGGVYTLPTGELIGDNYQKAIDFLKDPENQKVLDTIKVKIEG